MEEVLKSIFNALDFNYKSLLTLCKKESLLTFKDKINVRYIIRIHVESYFSMWVIIIINIKSQNYLSLLNSF